VRDVSSPPGLRTRLPLFLQRDDRGDITMKTLNRRALVASLLAALSLGNGVVDAIAQPPSSIVAMGGGAVASHVQSAPKPLATVSVTNCDDSGVGSLRDAIAMSDAVDLTELTCSRITLTSGALHTTQRLNLYGPGSGKLTIEANNGSRIFDADSLLVLTGVTIANGHAEGDGGCIRSADAVYLTDTIVSDCSAHAVGSVNGGGIFARKKLSLEDSAIERNTLTSDSDYATGGGSHSYGLKTVRSTIADNTATSGAGKALAGGAFSDYGFRIYSTTISGNRADASGALAVFSTRSGTASITSSTISGNRANKHIGGVFSDTTTYIDDSTIALNCAGETSTPYLTGIGLQTRFHAPKIRSSIIAKNGFCATGRADSPFDVGTYGTSESITGDHDLVMLATSPLPPDTRTADPMLATLADNGGPTKTIALLDGSPAIDAGQPFVDGHYDQRDVGFARFVGANADIGAFEVQSTGVSRPVRNCDDDGEGSLRRVVANSISGDTIDLRDSGCSTITLTSGELATTAGNLRIIGPGSSALTIDGNAQSRVLSHTGYGILAIDGLTLAHGHLDIDGKAFGGCLMSMSTIIGNDLVVSGCRALSESHECYGGGVYSKRDFDLSDGRVLDSTCGSAMYAHGGGIDAYGDSHLARATIAGNSAVGTHSEGGGIEIGGNATIEATTFTDNSANIAGAIAAVSYLSLADSTVSGNTALLADGGVFANNGYVVNSTIAFNTASLQTVPRAAGLLMRGRIESSIVFGNTLGGVAYDAGGLYSILAGSHNIIGFSDTVLPPDTIHSDPLLGPLAMNGGPTETHALGAGSPAIDAGTNLLNLAFDQRGEGFNRVQGDAADIGAFEASGVDGDDIFADGFERTIQR
jgi:hypothetical protein